MNAQGWLVASSSSIVQISPKRLHLVGFNFKHMQCIGVYQNGHYFRLKSIVHRCFSISWKTNQVLVYCRLSKQILMDSRTRFIITFTLPSFRSWGLDHILWNRPPNSDVAVHIPDPADSVNHNNGSKKTECDCWPEVLRNFIEAANWLAMPQHHGYCCADRNHWPVFKAVIYALPTILVYQLHWSSISYRAVRCWDCTVMCESHSHCAKYVKTELCPTNDSEVVSSRTKLLIVSTATTKTARPNKYMTTMVVVP